MALDTVSKELAGGAPKQPSAKAAKRSASCHVKLITRTCDPGRSDIKGCEGAALSTASPEATGDTWKISPHLGHFPNVQHKDATHTRTETHTNTTE